MTPSCKAFFAPAGPVDDIGISGVVNQCFRHAPVRTQQAVEIFCVLIAELPIGGLVNCFPDVRFQVVRNPVANS